MPKTKDSSLITSSVLQAASSQTPSSSGQNRRSRQTSEAVKISNEANFGTVIPANAGIQFFYLIDFTGGWRAVWIPAFAGMTELKRGS
ncbi:protein of unknown function [Denitratisoma oestradiolicum]|uniref:Uncharacterized protein n=1 Tax=Denitratisoma oestradiolicum TaxID=311182 RepID=A0A6S6Y3T3_9PROT|nr:protein of unknown function [Denitratisoma oestradiolicum]